MLRNSLTLNNFSSSRTHSEYTEALKPHLQTCKLAYLPKSMACCEMSFSCWWSIKIWLRPPWAVLGCQIVEYLSCPKTGGRSSNLKKVWIGSWNGSQVWGKEDSTLNYKELFSTYTYFTILSYSTKSHE